MLAVEVAVKVHVGEWMGLGLDTDEFIISHLILQNFWHFLFIRAY